MAEQAIACMGELGACAAGAGAYAFPFAHVMPQPSYQQALEALIEGAAGRALIPAYNTRTGAMPEALGLLARSDFEIVGEIWRRIELHVMVPRAWVKAQHPNYDDLPLAEKARARAGLLGLISDIYADQAAFNQYAAFLKRAVPRAQRRVTGCTGEAARVVFQGYRTAEKPERYPAYAALASKEAASMYGLVPLTDNLSPGETKSADPADNWTLFYIVEHRPHARAWKSDDRWSLFCSLYGEAQVRKRLRDSDLASLFEGDEQLARQLPSVNTRMPEDVHSGERDYDLAKVLYDTLAADRHALRRLSARARAAGMTPDQVRRVEAAEKDIEAALGQCARWRPREGHISAGLRGSKNVKSVIVARAKARDTNGERLLSALYGGKQDVNVRLVATLPPPVDGKAGPAFLIETDGYLAGINVTRMFLSGGSPAERLLGKLAAKGDVHVLGSLPRAAYPYDPAAELSEEERGEARAIARIAMLAPIALGVAAAIYFFLR